MILVTAPAREHPAHLAVGLQQAVFLGVLGAEGDAMLDAARHHTAVFGVYALLVVADGEQAGVTRVNAVQVGEVGVGNKAVFADIPVPGADRIRRRQCQLQALLAVVLGLEAVFGALLQFQGFAAAFVGFDGGDQDASDRAAFVAD